MNTAEGRSWSRIIEIARSRSRMMGLPTPQSWLYYTYNSTLS